MKIPKNYAHLAIEQTARRMEGFREGENRAVNIEKAKEQLPTEQNVLQSFFEKASQQTDINDIPGVQYNELDAARIALHQELVAVDTNNDGIDDAERQNMSKAGQVAMKLAETLMAKEPVKAMTEQTLKDLSPEEAIETIREASMKHVELGYGVARAIMFSLIDNQDGVVRDVYTDRKQETFGIPQGNTINTEHTWPKSRGVRDTSAISDLHHLFPTDSKANSRRASYPFGVVEKVMWKDGDATLGLDKNGTIVFEPPEEQRGDVARALFYVASSYDLQLLKGEPDVLLKWSHDDPVSDQERKRNAEISRFQRNRNPFVDLPDLADKLVPALSTREIPDKMRPSQRSKKKTSKKTRREAKKISVLKK